MEISKKIMTKKTDKQAIDNLADNFNGYAALLRKIKQRVLVAQQRAIYAANEEMLRMYWDIGGMLQQSQDADGWGKKTLQRLSVDLKNDYSEIKGFSVRNMQCMIQFFNEYNQELTMVKGADSSIAQSMIAQLGEYNFSFPIKHLGWTHNLILLQQVKDIRARHWYMVQSITSHWNTRYLQEAIKLDDYGKHGALANNFTETLPVPEANDVKSMLKDPYIFDVAGTKELADERDIEKQLVEHVTRYLLEMGNGFAFVAKQKHFQVGDSDFYADLILYSIKLHAYIVVELKATPFKPEYAGQLNFYINIVDDQLRGENDNKTIGLLLCKGKDEVVAQYALTGYAQPIGVSDYQLSKAIPENLKSALPSIEEVEEELSQLLDNKKDEK